MLLLRTSLAVLLLSIVQHAACKPEYFIQSDTPCLQLPKQGYGRHPGVLADKAVVYQLLLNKKPVTTVCAGQTYEVKVKFPAARLAILVSSAGTFEKSYNMDAKCPNRLLLDYHVNKDYEDTIEEYTATMTVPCGSTGKLTLSSASAANGLDSYHESSASVTIDASCAAATCSKASSGSKANSNSSGEETPSKSTTGGSDSSSSNTTAPTPASSSKTNTTNGTATAPAPSGSSGLQAAAGQLAVLVVLLLCTLAAAEVM